MRVEQLQQLQQLQQQRQGFVGAVACFQHGGNKNRVELAVTKRHGPPGRAVFCSWGVLAVHDAMGAPDSHP